MFDVVLDTVTDLVNVEHVGNQWQEFPGFMFCKMMQKH